MDWMNAVQFRAIAEWRDRHRLSIAARLNDAAIATLASFESVLSSAAWSAMLLDRETLAASHIDSEMRLRTEPILVEAYDAAARELRLIDARLEPIALALPRVGWPTMPALRRASEEKVGRSWVPTMGMPDRLKAWQSGGKNLAVVRRTVQAAQGALDASDARLRGWTGTHRRLCVKARDHVKDIWLGQDAKSRTVVVQIEESFDRSADQAREMLL